MAQGLASAVPADVDLPTTAKTESSRSTSGLPQFLQVVVAVAEFTILSNFTPQLRHRNSKIGILPLPQRIYRKPGATFNRVPRRDGGPHEVVIAAAFLLALLAVASSKMA